MFEKSKYLFGEIISALLVFLFVYAAISKLMNHDQFIFSLTQSPLTGKFAIPVSWLIPIIELITSILLIIPALRRWGLLISVLLMTAFTFYVGYMLLFIPDLPCSCGGVLKYMTWKQHIIFNISFMLLSIAGVYFYRKEWLIKSLLQ